MCLCVSSFPACPQGSGFGGTSVHHEEEDGAAERGAGADGATQRSEKGRKKKKKKNQPLFSQTVFKTHLQCLIFFVLPQSIESRLKVVLPEDLGSSLMDGVVLCHLANHIKPRSVASIHVPSPAVVQND